MKISDLSLGKKLGAAFCATVAVAAVVGAVGIFELKNIHANSTELADNWLPSVEVLGDLRTGMNRLARADAELVLAKSKQDADAAIRRADEIKLQLDKRIAAYEALVSSKEEADLYQAYRRELAAFQAKDAELRRIVQSEQDVNEGRDFFVGRHQQAFDVQADVLNSLVKLNVKGSRVAQASADATYDRAVTVLALLLVAGVVLGAGLSIWITRMITRPLIRGAQAAARIAEGDLTVAVAVGSKDESGQLLQALAEMKDKLSHIVDGVRRDADGVATASAQIAQGNLDLSSRTEEQASALEETAASMEQLSSTVRHNTDNARQANELALGASEIALRGGSVVEEVVATMRGINESSKQIAEIISVIDAIAFQTNILALNAAVEAARAGEQGRGFAVVATEVRTLAQRSAAAAKDIKGLIGESVTRVQHGTLLVDRAGNTMTEVVSSIKRVSDLMGEITAASIEQTAGIGQVSEAVTQMDQVTQQNAALVEESAAAAESLMTQAQRLVAEVAVFKIDSKKAQPRQAMAASAPEPSTVPAGHRTNSRMLTRMAA